MGLGEIWNSGVVQPLFNALVFLNSLLVGMGFGDVPLLGNVGWGLTIILFTIAIKTLTIPLTVKQLRSSKAMQELQPQLRALQKQYGKDRERLMQEQMRLYRENKINPAAGCLPLLIQMPVWFGLYQALFALANTVTEGDPYAFGGRFLWMESLARPEGIPYLLALLTGASQWVVQKMMVPQSTDPQQKMMNQMMQFMPIMFVFFAFSVPSGLVLYWVTSNLFSIVQQYYMVGWGALLPLPPFIRGIIGSIAPTTKEVTKPGSPGANGKRPATGEADQVVESTTPVQKAVDGADNSERGPGGGKKKRRIKRR